MLAEMGTAEGGFGEFSGRCAEGLPVDEAEKVRPFTANI